MKPRTSLEVSADTPGAWKAILPYIKLLWGQQGVTVPRPVISGAKWQKWYVSETLGERMRDILNFYRVPVRVKLDVHVD